MGWSHKPLAPMTAGVSKFLSGDRVFANVVFQVEDAMSNKRRSGDQEGKKWMIKTEHWSQWRILGEAAISSSELIWADDVDGAHNKANSRSPDLEKINVTKDGIA